MEPFDEHAERLRRAVENMATAARELVDALLGFGDKHAGRLDRLWKRIMAFIHRAGAHLDRLQTALERLARLSSTAASILATLMTMRLELA